jgi:hypothetical protein
MKVLNKEAAFYRDILPALNQIANLEYCPLIYVDETYGKEAIVLEHMKQFGWRDAINKKAGLSLEHVQVSVSPTFYELLFRFAQFLCAYRFVW